MSRSCSRLARKLGTATIPRLRQDAFTSTWPPEAGSRFKFAAGVWSVSVAKKSNGVVKKNSGASLVDLGDGVACIEFHSKMNSLGADIVGLILQTLKPGGPGDNFDAFVITNDAANFSVGANLMLLLMSVQEEEWDDVDLAIRQFQGMTQAIKFSSEAGGGLGVRIVPGRGHGNLAARGGSPASRRALYRDWSRSASACSLVAEAVRKCCYAPSTGRLLRVAARVPVTRSRDRSKCWKR